jgi:hypothetical protein
MEQTGGESEGEWLRNKVMGGLDEMGTVTGRQRVWGTRCQRKEGEALTYVVNGVSPYCLCSTFRTRQGLACQTTVYAINHAQDEVLLASSC